MELPISARYVGVAEWQVGTDELDFGFVAVGETKTAELIIENTTPNQSFLGSIAQTSLRTPRIRSSSVWDGVRLQIQATKSEFQLPSRRPRECLVWNLSGPGNRLKRTGNLPLKGTSIEGGQLGFLNGSGVLDFGDVHYGIGVERTLRLRNDGGSTLDVGTALTVGSELGFSIETPENFSLGPLEEAVVVVRLTGAAGGALEELVGCKLESICDHCPSRRLRGPAGSDVTDLPSTSTISLKVWFRCSIR